MTLHLVRHGETALNAARVLQPADTPLSAHGLAQAEALARRIAGWAGGPGARHAAAAPGDAGGAPGADAPGGAAGMAADAGELPVRGVLGSDLPRARQTAEAIATACGLPLQLSPLLQERNFGTLRGRPYDGLGFDPLAQEDAPPGGESMADFAARCAAAWAEAVALRQRLGGPLVVVTHGLVLRCWLARLPLQLPAGVAAPSAWHNTGLSSLGEGLGHRLRRVNCTAHLAGTLASGQRSLSGG